MQKLYFTFLVLLLSSQTSFGQLTVSFPDSSYTFFSETQVTETTIPIWVSNADTSHQAISFDFNFYYKLGDLQVKNVSMLPSGSFEFSVNPDGQNENEVVSGAGVLNSELVGNVHLFDVTFEIPTNLPSGFEKKIDWVNFRFTPKQPQIILEGGNLFLAKNGDFNKSNLVDSTDAELLLKKLTSKEQFTGFQTFVSDFDKNGRIQAFDCAKILEFVDFGIIVPEIFSFTISEFEADDFAVNSSPYSLKVNLNNSVSLNSISASIKIPNQDFAIDSVKIGTDFSTFLQTHSINTENEFTNINLGLASSNNLLNGDLELAEIFLTPLQAKNSSQIILSELVTNVEPEQTDKIFEIEILENSNNDSLDLIFSDSKFVGMNEQFELSLFTPRISSFWQIENLTFEIHFPASKFNLESFTSPYFEDLSRRTGVDKIEIRGKTTLPKDFSGNLFEFVFSSNEENLTSKDSFSFEIQNLQIASNFPFQFLENRANLISFKEGDLNADNSVDQSDVTELMTRLSLFETFDTFETQTVDFDNSETVTSFDASLLLKYLNNEPTNISKSFAGAFDILNLNLFVNQNESFFIELYISNVKNVLSGRGKINFNQDNFKIIESNYVPLISDTEFEFNNFGFCFANKNDSESGAIIFEILALQEGNFEISITDSEINGIAQPSKILNISVDENLDKLSFGLPYPNPISKDILSVNILQNYESVSYELFNVLGQKVLSGKEQNITKIEIPLLNSKSKRLANGVYFLTLKGKSLNKIETIKRSFTILK